MSFCRGVVQSWGKASKRGFSTLLGATRAAPVVYYASRNVPNLLSRETRHFTPGLVGCFRNFSLSTPNQKARQPPPDESGWSWKTISFYQFVPLEENSLTSLRLRLLKDLEAINVVGRIYVATEGINAQVSCPEHQLEALREYIDSLPYFSDIVFNFSTLHVKAFKKLHVRVRHQIVADGLDPSTYDLKKQPNYLSPEEWHDALSNNENPPLLIDMRNNYEAEIGKFVNSICPDVDTFRDEIKVMRELCEGKENEPIYMYCTGGIRCSKAGAILASDGFKNVNMLRGGVTAYGRYIRETQRPSIFIGKNFTFDKRLGEPITDDVIGHCHQCDSPADSFTNCQNTICNLLFIQCPSCKAKYKHTCGSHHCIESVDTGEARTNPRKQATMLNHTQRVSGKKYISQLNLS
ncbi:Rhodanese-like protein [Basidiobolus meristosporus CBS 931.73]|uniref:Rhodanese-like protein n=1 Tax=Basidiobolus meristosporus CBS 931.73 TaxID=1314790 RepID=A0A1Y1Y9S1_9FUNG|nr:Rhodanese-like protein [Basidiobolus meristosporus CBS 931.73]|eukprot:ORX94738.1 Rhodanese-like protein [Basidiobolus meristosporus CBS 931.73]